jgi:hypothetical protein
MKKLKLNLDSLRVDSFQTAAATDARGTVEGFATALRDTCGCPAQSDGCSIPSDGCSIGCPVTGAECGPNSNNCWTVIEY